MVFSVYIMASKRNGTLYTGSTDNLAVRAWEHRTGAREGFTKRHDCKLLVWHEQHSTRESAKWREATIKKWERRWKLDLIEATNPDWRDLYEDVGP